MIDIMDKSEFTLTITDLIYELSELDKFVLRIWTNNSELSYDIDESSDITFISESIKFCKDNRVNYVAMDSIVSVILLKNTSKEDLII